VRIELEEKYEIHKKEEELSPYKQELVRLFYGNDFERVITYHWVYQRPREENLREWHEIMTGSQSTKKR
jgi:hypothetical protein